MKLEAIKRKAHLKSETNRLRREGFIPAIIYHNGKPGEPLAVNESEYQALVRQVKKGHLSTTKITLTGAGNDTQAILKEIQYHPTTYNVLHLDFEQLDKDVPVNVKVPIECAGVMDCVGVKLGGTLRQKLRHLKVRCLPGDIPDAFTLNVKNLALGKSLRLNDIAIPETVRPLARMKEIAVSVARR
jgi:large subunit ribosomal protein L25